MRWEPGEIVSLVQDGLGRCHLLSESSFYLLNDQLCFRINEEGILRYEMVIEKSGHWYVLDKDPNNGDSYILRGYLTDRHLDYIPMLTEIILKEN